MTQKDFETNEVSNLKRAKDVLPIVGANGDYVEVYGKDAIANQIKTLLMTPLGSYPFDPEYGTLLYKQLFEQIDEVTEETIYYEVSSRVLKYVSGVSVESVDIVWNKKNKSCTVNVYYYIEDEENRTKLSVLIQNLVNHMYDAEDDVLYKDFRF